MSFLGSGCARISSGVRLAGAAHALTRGRMLFELNDMYRSSRLRPTPRPGEARMKSSADRCCRSPPRRRAIPRPCRRFAFLRMSMGDGSKSKSRRYDERAAPEIEPRVLPGRNLDQPRKRSAGKDVAMYEQSVAGTEGVQKGAGSPIAVHDLQKHGIEVGQHLPPAMRSYVEGHAGSMKRNVAPVVSDSAQMRPRCAWTMEREMDSPIPSVLVASPACAAPTSMRNTNSSECCGRSTSYSPAMVISLIRIEPTRTPPRRSTSLPIAAMLRYMSFRLPAMVISCTG